VLPRYDAISKVLTLQSYGRYVEQLLEFLVAMDEHGLVHLDIRPENIVWNAALDEIVVIDFELMRQLRSDGYCLLTVDDLVGCHPIIAPEIYDDMEVHGEHLCSSLCDVYSAGVTADLWRERLGDKAQALPKAFSQLIASMTERERKNRISAGAAFKQFLKVEALLKVVPSSKKPTDIVLAKGAVQGIENSGTTKQTSRTPEIRKPLQQLQ
jgi:serine/threonine protein kinase